MNSLDGVPNAFYSILELEEGRRVLLSRFHVGATLPGRYFRELELVIPEDIHVVALYATGCQLPEVLSRISLLASSTNPTVVYSEGEMPFFGFSNFRYAFESFPEGSMQEAFQGCAENVVESRVAVVVELPAVNRNSKQNSCSEANSKVFGQSVVAFSTRIARNPELDELQQLFNGVGRGPESLGVLLKRTERMLTENNFSCALILFREILERAPDMIEIWRAKALLELDLRLFHDCVDSVNAILERTPQDPVAHSIVQQLKSVTSSVA